MTLLRSARLALLSVSVFCSAAVAQGRFCLGGDLHQVSPAERNQCAAQLQTLQLAAKSSGDAADWHIVLVCGEKNWQDYSEFVADTRLQTMALDIRSTEHEVYLRSSQLAGADGFTLGQLLKRVGSGSTGMGADRAGQ